MWCLQGAGRLVEAKDVLIIATKAISSRGLVSSEVFLLHECARIGMADQFADRATALLGMPDSPFAHARLRHVGSRASGDPHHQVALADVPGVARPRRGAAARTRRGQRDGAAGRGVRHKRQAGPPEAMWKLRGGRGAPHLAQS